MPYPDDEWGRRQHATRRALWELEALRPRPLPAWRRAWWRLRRFMRRWL